jgi:DNA-binding transcriptional LysR family regulator
MINLHLLRIFVAVVDNGSFSAAARSLGISQPAASKAVRALETDLDTVLLERQGRGVRPTEPGNLLLGYGHAIFRLEQEAHQAIDAFYGLARGMLTIGASTTIATYWLPPHVMAFKTRYPGLTVRVVSANTRQITTQLLEGQLDVALVEGPVEDPRVSAQNWFEEEMVIIGHHSCPHTVTEPLHSQRWIVREPGSGSRDATERLFRMLGGLRPVMIEFGANEAVVQAVSSAPSYGFVPWVCARDQLELGRVKAVGMGLAPIRRQLYRLRLANRPVSHGAIAFEAALNESMKHMAPGWLP